VASRMNTTAVSQNTVNRHPADKRGIITTVFSLFTRILGVLLFSALISVIMEWAGMTWWYDYQDYEHSREMFRAEMAYLNSTIKDGTTGSVGTVKANAYVQDAINFVFVDSGFIAWLRQTYVVTPEDNEAVVILKGFQGAIYDYLIAMVYTLMTFTVRVAILTLSIPVFVIFGIVGLTDGLMKRDLRRFTGEHESSFVYHIAKGFTIPFMIVGWIIYLALPFSLHPNFIIIPFATFFAYAIYIAAAKFKKYL
jgi:integrating conjugative element membrane protein (TIGR03747 family)